MSATMVPDHVIRNISKMGFDPAAIRRAWILTSGNENATLNLLLDQNENSPSRLLPPPPSQMNDDDLMTSTEYFEKQTQRAILASVGQDLYFDNPKQMLREKGASVGLKNIGNSCYFNAFVQTIFHVEEFVKKILTFIPPSNLEKTLAEAHIQSPEKIKRKKDCLKLVLELQKLAVLAIYGNKKVLDPSETMKSIVDSEGKQMKIGEQNDVTEFSINFLEQIEEGLLLNEKGEKQQDEASINNLFFGKMKESITFQWDNVDESKKVQESIFGQINLSLKKDLISALEEYTDFMIDQYKAPNDKTTMAKKKISFLELPRVLNFVLPRLIFDKKDGLKKVSEKFTFPKEIYLDRFLQKNKKLMKNLTEQRKTLKIQEEEIDKEIEKLKNYKGSSIELMQVFGLADSFLLQEKTRICDRTQESLLEEQEDISDPDELQRFSEIIKQFSERTRRKLERLEQKKSDLKRQDEVLWQNQQNEKYALHSIVVHDGGCRSGHYYCFLYDPLNKKWKKYNDVSVTEVSEEEVFSSSFGGEQDLVRSEGSSCAYSLLYVKQDCKIVQFNDSYLASLKKCLPKEMDSYVEAEKNLFLIEYQHYTGKVTQKIYQEYLESLTEVVTTAQEIKNNIEKQSYPYVPYAIGFDVYLAMDIKNCSQLLRRSVLNEILTYKKVPYKILEGEINNFYYEELKEKIWSRNCPFELKGVRLSDLDQKLLIIKKKEFKRIDRSLIAIKRVLHSVILNDWKESMLSIQILQGVLRKTDMKQKLFSNLHQFSIYLLILVSLRFCALIDQYYMNCLNQQAEELLEILTLFWSDPKFVKSQEIFHKQICENLKNTIQLTENHKYTENQLTLLRHYLKKIQDKQESPAIDSVKLSSFEETRKEFANQYEFEPIPEFQTEIHFQSNETELRNLYEKVIKEELKVWVEMEAEIRTKKSLYSQERRVEKEVVTWF